MNRRVNRKVSRTAAALLAGTVFACSFASGQVTAYADSVVIGSAPGSINTESSSSEGNVAVSPASENNAVISPASENSAVASPAVENSAVISSASENIAVTSPAAESSAVADNASAGGSNGDAAANSASGYAVVGSGGIISGTGPAAGSHAGPAEAGSSAGNTAAVSGENSAGAGSAAAGSAGYAAVGNSAGYAVVDSGGRSFGTGPAAGSSGGYATAGIWSGAGPGTGGTGGNVDTSSPDWSDYKETGGTAQGALSVSAAIPAGCVDSCALEVSNPIVKNADKYSYDFMMNDLGQLQQRYGAYMTHHSLGSTVDGRNIEEVIVGNQNAPTHILITGAIHGREHITANLDMKQIEYIVAFASNGCFYGQRLSAWLQDVCRHFVPMINPDGVAISQYGVAGLRNQGLVSILQQAYANDVAMERTTLDFDNYLTRWKANARGVNLNDNFNALTGNITYRTNQPSSDVYYGSPGSEPETRAIQQLIDSRHFKAILNYHATGSILYWDFNENRLREHSRDLANNIRTISSYSLRLAGKEGGSVKAYAGTRANPSTCITVEVGISQAPVNPAEMTVIWSQNKFVPFYTMKWAKEKGK